MKAEGVYVPPSGRLVAGRRSFTPTSVLRRRLRIQAEPSRRPDDDEASSSSYDSVDVVESADADVDVFGELTSGDLTLSERSKRKVESTAATSLELDRVIRMEYSALKANCTDILRGLGIQIQHETTYPRGMPQRAVFCTRTLNLRSIQAIGLDMDYTLVDYDVNAWEGRAYEFALRTLATRGVPTEGLTFDKELVIRGLIIDTRNGNIVKVDRFGFVKRGMHGTTRMTAAEVRDLYGRELVNLKDEGRWSFMNTFFSVSEAVLYAQLVDRLDTGAVPRTVCAQTYEAVYMMVRQAIFDAHVEGKLKAEIMADPARFVRPDPELPQTLVDQRAAGKTLMLITNSDFAYTETVMTFAFGSGWKSLFDIVIVNARKPEFWSSDAQLYEVVNDEGLMRPAHRLSGGGGRDRGKLFSGGSAKQVQSALGLSGDEILYIGDHIYTDAALAKLQFSWRTCLILRELEQEIEALASGRAHRAYLQDLLKKKERVGYCFNQIRLERQRILGSAGRIGSDEPLPEADVIRVDGMNRVLAELLVVMSQLDDKIGPAIQKDGADFNERWGHLSRAGVNDRSALQKQVEKYADLYTSKVSNLGHYSPFVYFRSPTQSMTHDRPLVDDLVQEMQQDEGASS